MPRVQDEDFDVSTIIGKPLEVVSKMDLDWGSCYPRVNLEEMTVEGIVDGNHPRDFNEGNWEIVKDSYAVKQTNE